MQFAKTSSYRFSSPNLRRGLQTALIAALLAVGLALVASVALARDDGPSDAQIPAAWTKLSTADRINSAYAQGWIDGETRLLYLAYAVYDGDKLPAIFRSKVGWFATHAVAEVRQAHVRGRVDGKTLSAETLAELDRVLSTDAATYCDREDGDSTTTSTYFAINYSASGQNAIQELTIDQYKTSLDTSYQTIVDQYGWARPPVCGDGQVPCTDTATPEGKFPVLIAKMTDGTFGYVVTQGGSYAGFNVGDNPHTPLQELASVTSCMVLNSDFTQANFGGNNTAQENLDGTTSHEFVHAIQNAWGDPGEQMAAMWAESTAAYFEDEVFDNGNSQYIYLYGDFNNNSLNDWASGTQDQKDYENLLLFRYVAEQYGAANSATGGEKVIQKFFENVATGTPAQDQELASFKAAVESFARGGGAGSSDFTQLFHDFAIATKFVKDCQDESSYGATYCYEEGSEYRATTRNFAETGNVPQVALTANLASSVNGTVKNNYGINWVRLPAKGNGSYKIDLAASTATALKASVVCDNGSSLAVTSFPALVTGSTAQTIPAFDPQGCNDVILVITNQHEGANVAHAYTVTLGTAVATPKNQLYLPVISRP